MKTRSNYVRPTSTYYGLATASYRDTRRCRNINVDAYDALGRHQLAGFEYECDLNHDAWKFLMDGRVLECDAFDFEAYCFPDKEEIALTDDEQEQRYDEHQMIIAENCPF